MSRSKRSVRQDSQRPAVFALDSRRKWSPTGKYAHRTRTARSCRALTADPSQSADRRIAADVEVIQPARDTHGIAPASS
ncbi:MAG: hypothetical protein QOC89_4068 [Paraburkholderia sp.]|jgi:hypothetical protein|nr:hypothetical protein [Paraburkholderia sp.]MEA3128224.1 hypothetical protein [Paraburkholderia sp.]